MNLAKKLAISLFLNSANCAFQNDLCSYVHSQFVIDKVNSVVKPIFSTYGIKMVDDPIQCTLNNFMKVENYLKQFTFGREAGESGQAQNYRCGLCNKLFDSEDYLEFHFKTKHAVNDKLQTSYNVRGSICPAELCDIFECPELSFKALRFQVYTQRTDGNYDNKHDQRHTYKRTKKGGAGYIESNDHKLPPFRYEMIQHYDSSRKATLHQQCQRTFLDCVDHESSTVDNIMKAYDFFNQIFCMKFEEGYISTEEEEQHDKSKVLGMYKMLEDIHDSEYQSPSPTLKQQNEKI